MIVVSFFSEFLHCNCTSTPPQAADSPCRKAPCENPPVSVDSLPVGRPPAVYVDSLLKEVPLYMQTVCL